MRRKRSKNPDAPPKYLRFNPRQWPDGGFGQWIAERERWNAAQHVDIRTGAGPLGDKTKLLFDRREARWTWFAYLHEIHSDT